MIALTFACGHGLTGEPTVAVCSVCGDTRVVRVSAPAPTIRGSATGPYVQTDHAMGPAVVPLATRPLWPTQE